MAIIGTTIAPLVGLQNCDLFGLKGKPKELQVDEDLFFEVSPRVEVDDFQAEFLGNRKLEELRLAGWGFKHIYEADDLVHLGPKEEESTQVVHQALLALWLTKPTGANYSYILLYRGPNQPAATIEGYDSIKPHPAYEKEGITSDDLEELKQVWTALRRIFSDRKRVQTLNHLYGALHLQRGEPRFTMLTVVLESLFTTGKDEIAHKVSERIAFLLEKDPMMRHEVFKLVKKIYGVRSTIVHGGQLKLSSDEFMDLGLKLEYLVQRILKRIVLDDSLISSFSGNQNVRERFLTDLLFT